MKLTSQQMRGKYPELNYSEKKGITITTDASWHPEWKVGGYAFMIASDMFRGHGSGMFKTRPKNPTTAEVMCIGNALVRLQQRLRTVPKQHPVEWLLINTDCVYAITAIEGGTTELFQQVKAILHAVLKEFDIPRYEFRYVRAHTTSQSRRSLANEWCDKQAKKHMRQAVQIEKARGK